MIFEITYQNGAYSVVNTQTHQHLSLNNGKLSFQGNGASFSLFSVTV